MIMHMIGIIDAIYKCGITSLSYFFAGLSYVFLDVMLF